MAIGNAQLPSQRHPHQRLSEGVSVVRPTEFGPVERDPVKSISGDNRNNNDAACSLQTLALALPAEQPTMAVAATGRRQLAQRVAGKRPSLTAICETDD